MEELAYSDSNLNQTKFCTYIVAQFLKCKKFYSTQISREINFGYFDHFRDSEINFT